MRFVTYRSLHVFDVCRRAALVLTVACVVSTAVVRVTYADPIPSPWLARDIGALSIAGNSSFDPSQNAFTLTGAGADIWGVADQFHFTYQQISGDVDVVARVDSILHADPWSKAGVMIRSSLAAGAAQGLALVSAQKGVAFQWRGQLNGTSTNTAGDAVAAPYWVRLVRAGTRLTAYSSSNGTTWKTIGSATIALGTSAYVGLAVTSHIATAATMAVVSRTTVTPLSLPAPQKDADIGSPPVPGSAKFRLGTYTVVGSGADIWGQADEFNYVYQPIAGDMDVSARVASLQGPSTWTKAGVMIRESLADDARHALVLISTAKGSAFQRRIDPGGFSFNTAGPAIAPPGWVRLVRSGNQFTAYTSTDGVKWTTIGTDTVPMGATVYVGFVVTSHSTSAAATASIDQFKLTQSGALPNQPPIVKLTAPAGGSTFTALGDIVISAQASDPENRLARVDLYAGTTRIASLTAAPFSGTWKSVPAGSYSLKAVATDLDGGTATSLPVTITVATSTTATVPTTVVFQKSADHATLVQYYLLEVFAAGANPSTATPVAAVNVAKPTPDATGTITLNEAAFFSALAPRSYIATVSAVGSGGKGRSAPVSFTR
jgi:regulation of enolase protein 1 (concanavalin A-like superfamily)